MLNEMFLTVSMRNLSPIPALLLTLAMPLWIHRTAYSAPPGGDNYCMIERGSRAVAQRPLTVPPRRGLLSLFHPAP